MRSPEFGAQHLLQRTGLLPGDLAIRRSRSASSSADGRGIPEATRCSAKASADTGSPVVDVLGSAPYWRMIVLGEEVDDGYLDRLVDLLVRGLTT